MISGDNWKYGLCFLLCEAVFHSSGTRASFSDKFIMKVRGAEETEAPSFNIADGISSHPVPFLRFKAVFHLQKLFLGQKRNGIPLCFFRSEQQKKLNSVQLSVGQERNGQEKAFNQSQLSICSFLFLSPRKVFYK